MRGRAVGRDWRQDVDGERAGPSMGGAIPGGGGRALAEATLLASETKPLRRIEPPGGCGAECQCLTGGMRWDGNVRDGRGGCEGPPATSPPPVGWIPPSEGQSHARRRAFAEATNRRRSDHSVSVKIEATGFWEPVGPDDLSEGPGAAPTHARIPLPPPHRPHRGGLLEDLLVPPLDGAVALEEVHTPPVLVRQHLHLKAGDGGDPGTCARGSRGGVGPVHPRDNSNNGPGRGEGGPPRGGRARRTAPGSPPRPRRAPPSPPPRRETPTDPSPSHSPSFGRASAPSCSLMPIVRFTGQAPANSSPRLWALPPPPSPT